MDNGIWPWTWPRKNIVVPCQPATIATTPPVSLKKQVISKIRAHLRTRADPFEFNDDGGCYIALSSGLVGLGDNIVQPWTEVAWPTLGYLIHRLEEEHGFEL